MENIKILDVLKIQRVGVTPCYESTWRVSLEIDNKGQVYEKPIKNHGYLAINGGLAQVKLTRLDVEREENMIKEVVKCKTIGDVCKLYFEVYYD